MKYILIGLIKIYQLIPGPWHDCCRFTPTCSEYAIESLKEYGLFKGSILTIKRLFRCNPFEKIGYDPIPERENL